jgi:hypothetical protein
MSRTYGNSWLKYIGVAVVVVCLAGIVCAQIPTTYSINYYSNPSPTTKDTTIKIANPGYQITAVNGNGFPLNGNLCAMIYVFNNDEQVVECCGCMLTPDSRRSISLNGDLLANPVNGNLVTTDGVIEIVSAQPNAYIWNPYPYLQWTCDPTGDSTQVYKFPSIVPTLELEAWGSHQQVEPGPAYTETEVDFAYANLNYTAFTNTARYMCSAIGSGSGKGVCTCGTGD